MIILWLAALACWLFAWLDGVAFLLAAGVLLSTGVRALYLLKSRLAWVLWSLGALLLPVVAVAIAEPIVGDLAQTALSGGFGSHPASPIPPLPTGFGTAFLTLSGIMCLLVGVGLGIPTRTRSA